MITNLYFSKSKCSNCSFFISWKFASFKYIAQSFTSLKNKVFGIINFVNNIISFNLSTLIDIPSFRKSIYYLIMFTLKIYLRYFKK